jgi:predicted esterase
MSSSSDTASLCDFGFNLSSPSATHSFIFLHGLGESVSTLVAVFQPLFHSFPHCRFLFPCAPSRRLIRDPSLTLPAWFNPQRFFRDQSYSQIDPKFNPLECPNSLYEARELLLDIIYSESQRIGGRLDHIFLIGHSQGAAAAFLIAQYLLFTSRQCIGGIVALSGYYPKQIIEYQEYIKQWIERECRDENKDSTSSSLLTRCIPNIFPVLAWHSQADQVIPFQFAMDSFEFMKSQWLEFASARVAALSAAVGQSVDEDQIKAEVHSSISSQFVFHEDADWGHALDGAFLPTIQKFLDQHINSV